MMQAKQSKSILIVSPIFPPEIGGPASYVPELASRFSKTDRVTVVTFCSQKPIPAQGFGLVWVPVSGLSILRQLKLLKAILAHASNSQTIYAQGTLTVGLMSLIAARLMGKRLVIKYVGDEVWEVARNQGDSRTLEEYYQIERSGLSLKMHRLVLILASSIIVPSQYLKIFLVQYHQVEAGKIQVVANPVELPRSLTHPGREESKKKLKQAIFVGRLVAWKHVDELINAWSGLTDKNWKLEIVGSGPDKEELEQLTQKLGLSKQIKFHGSLSREKTLTKIKQCQVLILPSDYEGQSHVIIEALQLGIPVIARDIPPNRELVKQNGVLLSQFDGKSLTQAIKSIDTFKIPKGKYIKHHSWDNHLKLLATTLANEK